MKLPKPFKDVPVVTVTFKMQTMPDSDPDLSYLEQDYNDVSPEERSRYCAQDAARLAAYHAGEWYMLGVRAIADIEVRRMAYSTTYRLESTGLWGIESDSDDSYIKSVFADQCAELKADIKAMRHAKVQS